MTSALNNLLFVVKVNLKAAPRLQDRIIRLVNCAHYLCWFDLAGTLHCLFDCVSLIRSPDLTHSFLWTVLEAGYYSYTELYERGLLTDTEIAEMRRFEGPKSPLALLWALEDMAAFTQKSVDDALEIKDRAAQGKPMTIAKANQTTFAQVQVQILLVRAKFAELATMRRVGVPVIYTHMLW